MTIQRRAPIRLVDWLSIKLECVGLRPPGHGFRERSAREWQARQKGSGMRAGQGLETPRAMGIWSFPAGCHGNGL